MTNDERDLTPDADLPPSGFEQSDDDLRYAPPVKAPVTQTEEDSSVHTEPDTQAVPVTQEPSVELASDSLPVNVTDGLDIEAALAAVSTLSDVMAEQEAAEQARVVRVEAEAQAKAERQARMENPERFFSVPPLTILKRGQPASIIPAVWLVGLGAWLTFTLTTTRTAPDPSLLILVIALGLSVTLLARWLASHRWARGSLFFGLVCLFFGGLFFYLNQPNAPGFANAWPLFVTALGIAMLLTRFLAIPGEKRLSFPGMILIIAGLAGTVITMRLLADNITVMAASLWPVALVIIVVIWLFPLVFRQRQ